MQPCEKTSDRDDAALTQRRDAEIDANMPAGQKVSPLWYLAGAVGVVALLVGAAALVALTAPITIPVLTATVTSVAAFLAASHVLPLIEITIAVPTLITKLGLGAIALGGAILAGVSLAKITSSPDQPEPTKLYVQSNFEDDEIQFIADRKI